MVVFFFQDSGVGLFMDIVFLFEVSGYELKVKSVSRSVRIFFWLIQLFGRRYRGGRWLGLRRVGIFLGKDIRDRRVRELRVYVYGVMRMISLQMIKFFIYGG